MSAPHILVTGANGQLGKELQAASAAHPQFTWTFVGREDLPVHEFEKVRSYFEQVRPGYCINCAAYTAVDKAETDKDNAFLVNAAAVGVLAEVCQLNNTKLIHISTDYVFDGTSPVPYKEEGAVNPVNIYGASKLQGEELCMQYNPHAIIIRTAWVYSVFGHNFVKTMLRLMNERPEINVVNDQVGAPTYAADLAAAILVIIHKHAFPPAVSSLPAPQWLPGIYHYSNQGRISWYDFAVAIAALINSSCKVNAIPSSQFPTPAKRPSFSLLDTHKIQTAFSIAIPGWKEALQRCLQQLTVKQ